MESRKRKPFSDLTNTYNLIPTSTLRKLVASSSNSSAFSKPPISFLKPNSTNQKSCSDSRSDTSIGSSNNVSTLRNSKAVQFRTPKRVNPEITSPERSFRSKDASYNRREVIEKSNKSREADCVPFKILNIENEICNAFGGSLEKTKNGKKASLKPSDESIAKTKETREGIPSPSYVALTVNCPRPRRKSETRNNDAGVSMLRTKNIQNDLDEGRDIKSSKSWTDPHPKCRKKRCSRNQGTSELPLEFIEQQRAYFKEVDEFELPEEEISQDGLD